MADDNTYNIVKVIKTEDGLAATVTARTLNGRRVFSFSIRKEYDRDGKVNSTAWVQKTHFASMRKLLDQVEDYIMTEEDKDRAKTRPHSAPPHSLNGRK